MQCQKEIGCLKKLSWIVQKHRREVSDGVFYVIASVKSGNTMDKYLWEKTEEFMNKVVICGVNTQDLPRLNQDKKTVLLQRIARGDKEAREEFINGNLRLVLSVIKKFSNRGENPDDLFQIGCVGLMKAIDNFDLSHDVRFSTYAVPMILGEIKRYLRDSGAVKVSRSLKDIAYRALSAKEKLTISLGHEPTPYEIAKEIGVTPKEVSNALDAICDPVSLYEPIYNDGGDVILVMDQLSDTKQREEKWLGGICVSQAMGKLSEKERKILSMRFFEDKTQTEIAEEIHISQAQVSRLEKNALISMRKYIN